MKDFLRYVYGEVAAKRLQKPEAMELLRQFHGNASAADAVIHPLLHRNTSTLEVQRFSSTFTGDEFFLRDHLLNGTPVLAGVCHLEMMRAAVQAATANGVETVSLTLRNVAWVRPFTIGSGPRQAHVALQLEADGRVKCEVYSEASQEAVDEPMLHASGTAELAATEAPARIDVAALQSGYAEAIGAAACYEAFRQTGFAHGPAYQGIEALQVGAGERPYVLAKLHLPATVRDTAGQYVLHPSLLDSALQGAIGFLLGGAAAERHTVLPFALDALSVYRPIPASCYAYLRYASDSDPTRQLQKFDVDVCDVQGDICASLRGFSGRRLGGEGAAIARNRVAVLVPAWKPVDAASTSDAAHAEHRVIILGGTDVDESRAAVFRAALAAAFPRATGHFLVPAPAEPIGSRYRRYATALISQIQDLLARQDEAAVLVQVVVPVASADDGDALLAGLAGLLRSACMEHARLHVQWIAADARNEIAALQEGRRCVATSGMDVLRYREGTIERAALDEAAMPQTAVPPWKDEGVYLITGGLGGLGMHFAADIARCARSSKIVLIGRSPLDDAGERKLQSLRNAGACAEYRALDVADAEQVRQLVEAVLAMHGRLTAVLHAAGVVRDGLLQQKTPADVDIVLVPKVDGTLHLDQATRNVALEHFVLFSSIAATFGNAGQSDYAAANGFLDAFAGYRNVLAERGERQGRTMTIAWPLWADGGMQPGAATLAQLHARGAGSMPTPDGLETFYRCVRSGVSSVVIVYGDPARLLAPARTDAREAVAVERTTVAPEMLERATQYLKELLSGALKLPAERIEADAQLEKYGIDSVMVMRLTSDLERVFGSLPKTLFFEYQTLADLTRYFLDSHREKLIALLGDDGAPPSAAAQGATQQKTANPRLHALRRDSRARDASTEGSLDIAIIGMSGRYPKARDLQEYWENLRQGVDCITEVPKDRWDHDRYYHPDKGEPGKTYAKWGGFLHDVDKFDPRFFSISPREAERMDPQERLFLQCAYETLEDAGYTRESLRRYRASGLDGNVGVFVGVMSEEYQLYGAQAQILGQPFAIPASPASIANRVSYFLNLHGPSFSLDTMCSSSLTAIHLACESLRSGGCEMAIAGGVNLLVHPNKYFILAQARFASSRGRCESFGESGDGYVPGEGVGAVMLKPLARAIEDGDHIYGVIKASAINHGGKTNGYTVPNPLAQASVIARTLKAAGIPARAIGYVEAHGTGTSLGDPIEIAGLTRAFREHTNDNQFCAIGSAKSNVGHLESAAGIAGLAKVLLQFKHEALAPSLHATTLNPNIDFSRTPFVVQRELAPWKRPRITAGEQTREYRRIAGISSFGAGGSNVHLIVEEFEEAPAESTVSQPEIFILSARSDSQLKEQARQLSERLRRGDYVERDLTRMAHTLQVGREAMEHRLAFVARSLDECGSKLDAFLCGSLTESEGHVGTLTRDSAVVRDGDSQLEAAALVDRDQRALAALWVKGARIDWEALRGDRKPRRIALPTYPFARERYWIPMEILAAPLGARPASLHPLLHHNVSTLEQQRFVSSFTGDEYFLKDHVVRAERILPGVAYLEMVRAAVMRSLGEESVSGIELRGVVWSRPAIADAEGLTLYVALAPAADDSIDFEVYSEEPGDDEPTMRLHAQGRAIPRAAADSPVLELAALRTACDKAVTAAQCYEAFRAMGIEHGPAYQSLSAVAVGKDAKERPYVIATLELPESLESTCGDHALHPSLADGAIQSVIGLMLGAGSAFGTDPLLPFALDSFELYRPLGKKVDVLLRLASGPEPIHNAVRRFDIDMVENDGTVSARLRGFSARPVPSAEYGARVALLVPRWMPAPPATTSSGVAVDHRILLAGSPLHPVEPAWSVAEMAEIQAAFPGARCLPLPQAEWQGTGADTGAYYARCAADVLAAIRESVQRKVEHPVLLQIVVRGGEDSELLLGLSRLVCTASLENPKIIGQVIWCPADETVETLVRKLAENGADRTSGAIRYENGVRCLETVADLAVEQASPPWKEDGVYVITGGAGGLGVLLAKEIAQCARGATVVLAGRSPLAPDKRARLEEIEATGAAWEYHVVDVAEREAVDALVRTTVQMHGKVDGVIHAAGVLRDGYVADKSEAALREVYAPKVAGALNLDHATRDLVLDFFVLFSSLAAVAGNAGQADYASANNFLDRFAAYRNRRVASGERRGRTVSIGWPLWADGGMRVDDATRKRLRAMLGAVPLPTAAGFESLYKALGANADHVIVVSGDVGRIKQRLSTPIAASKPPENAAVSARAEADIDELAERVRTTLRQMVAKLLKARTEEIDVDVEFSEFGFDSIVFTEFSTALNEAFRLALTPTVFFEHSTVRRLVRHLVLEHRSAFAGVQASGVSAPAPRERTGRDRPLPGRVARRPLSLVSSGSQPAAFEPVAIVGMSGRFPQAPDLDAFWRNIVEGRDCIAEVPSERWDWRTLYGDPSREANKTNIKWGGFIDGIDEFDPLFFGISPREALLMDPQQRLLMSYAWKAIEDAGYAPGSLSGTRTAIFVGTAESGYSSRAAQAGMPFEGYTATGAAPSLGPGRMSFLLNLKGPSEPIETACSSSLVAVHRAMLAINADQCDMAIVGGVNTIVTPTLHISFTKAGMLCEDGRCKTFSKDANGYVRGEGVGMLVLKRLRDAERDGDHIHGVIRGTAQNHGGRAASLTAPNPNAQTELLLAAYRRAGIDPRTIGYIETHGTGTPLGDPIEIAGLASAFRELYASSAASTSATARCGLGSVKTNVGHLELAAGVAGLIKVLLQFRHRTLAPSLHCSDLNPHIRLQDTPFYVVREPTPWEAPRDEHGNVLPRRAGVSSFGFSGANAHVVLEEYVSSEIDASNELRPERPAVIVLSARNEARLREQAQNLLSAVTTRGFRNSDLGRIACTLQVGRDAMEHRLAFTAASLDVVKEKLQAFVSAGDGAHDVYVGHVARNKQALSLFKEEEDLQAVVNKWATEGRYQRLLELWVNGLNVDWRLLYGETPPGRIPLPTYPFARERYWIDVSSAQERSAPASMPTAAVLHPLLHRNISTLHMQRFSSTFSGDEFFLRDHRVQGTPVLPAVAHLEMMYAAVSAATEGEKADAPPMVALENVVFLRPAAVERSTLALHVTIEPQTREELTVRLCGACDTPEAVVYSQARARILRQAAPPAIDLAMLTKAISEAVPVELCYAAFEALGLYYGNASRGLKEVHLLEGGTSPEVLARLELPIEVRDSAADYHVHPTLLDSALQAGIGLYWKMPPSERKVMLPFAIKAVRIFGMLPRQVYAHVRSAVGNPSDENTRTLDIDVFDASGRVCLKIEALVTRKLNAPVDGDPRPLAAPSADCLIGDLSLTPVWNPVAAPIGQVCSPDDGPTLVIGAGADEYGQILQQCPTAVAVDLPLSSSIDTIAAALDAQSAVAHLVWWVPMNRAPMDEISVEAQREAATSCLRLLKALISRGYEKRALRLTVLTRQAFAVRGDDALNPSHAAIHGLMGSMAKECSLWRVRLLDIEAGAPLPSGILADFAGNDRAESLSCRRGEWYREQLLPAVLPARCDTRFRQGGVYVIVGGAGGIGRSFTEYLIATYRAHVIWLGRREKDETIEAAIARLAAHGPAPWYLQADASDGVALGAALAQIKQKHGVVHGVVHAAIVYEEKSIAQIAESEFEAGLSAKIDSSVNVVRAFEAEPLDFLLFLSSLQSFSRAPGLASYVAGCTFQDVLAAGFAARANYAVKTIHWGYWGSVGVVATQAHRALMRQMGIGSIEPPEAMAVVEALLCAPLRQLVFAKVTRAGALRDVPVSDAATVTIAADASPTIDHVASTKARVPAPVVGNAESEPRFEDLLAARLYTELHALGLFGPEAASIEEWKQQLAFPSVHDRWLAESLRVLATCGYIASRGEQATAIAPPSSAAVRAAWEEARRTQRDNGSFALVDATLDALPDILRGRRQATDVLFPNSSMSLVEGVYKSAQAEYLNEVLAETIAAAIEVLRRENPNGSVRILEIGSGTGGTTATVLRRLAAHREHIAEYCYTDVSPAFLLHGKRAFGRDHPYLTFRSFNVEQPVESQLGGTGTFDCVIAANVLHATSSIRLALRNAKALLKRHGLLFINEIAEHNLFSHLTFGLLKGWWLHEDTVLRIPGSPALSADMWELVLRDEGYDRVVFPALEGSRGSQIIVAQSDGIVRQPMVAAGAPQMPPHPDRKAIASSRSAIGQTAKRDDLEALIREKIAQALHVSAEQIMPDKALADYGVDSIIGVQIIQSINDALQVDVPTVVLFEYSSLRQLTEGILTQFLGVGEDSGGGTPPAAPNASRDERRSAREQVPVVDVPSPSLSDASPALPSAAPKPNESAIAIIGMSGRLPGANSVQEFWENLKAGKDAIAEIPGHRWQLDDFFIDDRQLAKAQFKSYSRWGGFLDDVESFDPALFRMEAAELEACTTSERLFLEAAWTSLESAAYTRRRLEEKHRSRVGVYVGAMYNLHRYGPLSISMIANRTSRFFNCHGPSIAVDTASSSSLTAIAMACDSLLRGDCELAIAGGVNVLGPSSYVMLSQLNVLGSRRDSRSFSAGDGAIIAECVGAFLLKPLSNAVADGDPILAVIKEIGTAHAGGGSGSGQLNPRVVGDLVEGTLKRAGTHPRTITYVESAANGVPLGDAAEVSVLARVFRAQAIETGFCGIGSAKSNVGHAEAASSMPGLMKTVLQLQHGQLVPSIGVERMNPELKWESSPFRLQRELEEWTPRTANGRDVDLRRALVNSFGLGGSYVSMVVEEYSRRPTAAARTAVEPELIVLSARDGERLHASTLRLIDFLANNEEVSLADVAYTLQVGREEMETRLAVVATNTHELLVSLRESLRASELTGGHGATIFFGSCEDMGATRWLPPNEQTEESLVRILVTERNLARLATYWVQGGTVPWDRLARRNSPRRIALPTYPFAREGAMTKRRFAPKVRERSSPAEEAEPSG